MDPAATKPPWFALIRLGVLILLLPPTAYDIHRVNSECDRDQGIVVRGGHYLRDTGISGYICVEKGQH